MEMDAHAKRIAFISLGGVALATLVVALVVALLAVRSVATWLVACLVVLLLVLAAEVVLLVMDRPRHPHAPRPHYGPGYGGHAPEDDDVVETFVVEEDETPHPR